MKPLTGLFQRIYTQKTLLAQWSVSKIIPIHKKDPKAILKTIQFIESLSNVDWTGKPKHGFQKRKKHLIPSTQTTVIYSQMSWQELLCSYGQYRSQCGFWCNRHWFADELTENTGPSRWRGFSYRDLVARDRYSYVEINKPTSCFSQSNQAPFKAQFWARS